MAHEIKRNIIRITELHRGLGRIIRRVALSDDHFIVEKGGLPVAVLVSMKEYERLARDWNLEVFQRHARALGEEAEQLGITEQQLATDLKEDKEQIYKDTYGRS
ncbi:MAG: type II toxin-antitoxin system prevent-host-death family antitoxin [Anaerolineales bacterium]